MLILGEQMNMRVGVKGLDFVEITDAELDNTTYEAAEKKYLENNQTQAITAFEKYLKEFPSGLHALQSHYYLAELYVQTKNPDAAVPHYQKVLEGGRKRIPGTIIGAAITTIFGERAIRKSNSATKPT